MIFLLCNLFPVGIWHQLFSFRYPHSSFKDVFKDVILNCRSFILKNYFFWKKSWKISRSWWLAFLIAIYLKRRIAANIMFLASTVLAKRGSRAVFGCVKIGDSWNNEWQVFCIVHSFIYQKYQSSLLTTLSWFQNDKICWLWVVVFDLQMKEIF